MGLVVALLATAGCDSSTTGGSSPGAAERSSIVMSYAGAGGLLAGLSPSEIDEQLRDFVRVGLASHLRLTTRQTSENFYDGMPVRDQGFADLVRQPTGEGRSLLRGDELHVLIAQDDPHPARTIGLAIDQSRIDAGEYPEQVQVHRYRLNRDHQTIELDSQKALALNEIRAANGYVTMRVDQAGELHDFLARTTHVSSVAIRGAELHASGWNWPDLLSAPLDDEDLAVLQQEFQRQGGIQPSFSLDPGPPPTIGDVRALLPELAPRWTEQLAAFLQNPDRQPPKELAKKVRDALFGAASGPDVLTANGQPLTRTHLFALHNALQRLPMYSQASYSGDIAGTKLARTFFYTDHTAKNWVTGVGDSVPAALRPDAEAVLGHCPQQSDAASESGRLWFAHNDSGFDITKEQLSIGAQATRLFSRSDGVAGTEVEPSFSFARPVDWWDRNYQEIADYDVQYQRLDQILRWSGVLEWLGSKGKTLPTVAPPTPSALKFQDWYEQNKPTLRERVPIEFVAPPSATGEAILPEPSEPFEHCGFPRVFGGVSFGGLLTRRGGKDYQSTITGPARRAALVDGSSLDQTTGAMQVNEVTVNEVKIPGTNEVKYEQAPSVQRTVAPAHGAAVTVQTSGKQRKATSFGRLKVWLTEGAARVLTNKIVAGHGRFSQTAEIQGHQLGTLDVSRAGDTIMIRWRPGLLDRVRRALESIQRRSSDRPDPVDGVLYGVEAGNGQMFYKVGEPDEPWLTIVDDARPPGEELSFRLGSPGKDGQPPNYYQAYLARGPPSEPPGYLGVIPATAETSARVVRLGQIEDGVHRLKVTTLDGSSTLYVTSDGRPLVVSNDGIVGIGSTVAAAAMLRDWGKIHEANRAARQAGDKWWRAVRLHDDGVAFVGTNEIILRPSGDPWSERALAVMTGDPSRLPLMHIEGNVLRPIEPAEVVVGASPARRQPLGDVLTSGYVAYADESLRSALSTENGLPVADPLHRDLRVIVREVRIPNQDSAVLPEGLPDIVMFRDQQLHRVVRVLGNEGSSGARNDKGASNDESVGGGGLNDPGGGGRDGQYPPGPVTSSSTNPSPMPSIADVQVLARGGQVLLVCLDDGRGTLCEG